MTLVDLCTSQLRRVSGFTNNELQSSIEVSGWFPELPPVLSLVSLVGALSAAEADNEELDKTVRELTLHSGCRALSYVVITQYISSLWYLLIPF